VVWTGLTWLRNEGSWKVLVNTVMNLGFHEMLGNSRVAERLVASHEELAFKGLVFSFTSSATSNLKCRQTWPV
jgi:hypothetical protein